MEFAYMKQSGTLCRRVDTDLGGGTLAKNLEGILQGAGNIVGYLRNMQSGPNVYPGVPPEFTNWRDEQQSWQKTCVLFNQSYHMAELALEGPDALKLLTQLGVNTFANFKVDTAKQFVPCTPDGYVIGDVILFHLAENSFNMVGRIPVLNWVRYHAETGGYNVNATLDERSAARPDPFNRKSYRFQIQGPNAVKVMEKATGRPAPGLKFFHMTRVVIGGKTVRALRHGMAGQAGYELFGPWVDGEAVREALVAAGQEFGLEQCGGRAYSSNGVDSFTAAGDLHRRRAEGLSRVAGGRLLRGQGLHRRQLRLRQDRGLLPDAVGPGLWLHGQVRPRFHRARRARSQAEGPAPQEGDAGAGHRGRAEGDRVATRARRPRQVHGVPIGGLFNASLRPRDRQRQGRRYLDVDRLQLE
jgi:hypothetical protein